MDISSDFNFYKNFKKEVIPTVLNHKTEASSRFVNSHTALFDKDYNTGVLFNAAYGDNEIEFKIDKKCKLYSYGTIFSDAGGNTNQPMEIQKLKDSGVYEIIGSTNSTNGHNWVILVEELEPGTYKFKAKYPRYQGYTQWYFESINTNKFLLKQNNQYYTLKSEFYKNSNYEPIRELEEKEILTETDFETYGIDDLNLLTETIDNEVINGIDKGSLGNGKYFEIILNNFIKTINSQLIYKYKKPSYTDAIYYWVKSDYYGGGTMPIHNEVEKLFDGDINTSVTTTIHGAHFGIKFNHPTCIRKIEINIGTYDFLSVFSSNDGIEWNNIVQYTREKSIILDDYGNYLYYRFFVKRSNDYTTVREITLYELIKNYYLIQYNSQIYTFNGTNIILSPSQVLDENNFTNNGFIDVAEITEEQWNTTFPDKSNVKLLMWTDDMSKTDVNIETEITPFRPIDKLKKNSDIGNILFNYVSSV